MAIKENQITICGHGSDRPSLKNMTTYLTSRYNTFMSNGKRKGVLCVRRLKAMTDAKRQEFHDTYKTILGRNYYNQNLRDYVYKKYYGKYYSDCSSSGMATMNKIGLSTSGLLNTVGIKNSPLFENVPVTIVRGHITNPEILKVGDCILFAGNATRPSENYCGHVEYVYEIDGQVIPKKDEDYEFKPGVNPIPERPITNDLFIGKITASALNIRKQGNTSSAIVGTFHKGEYVCISSIKDGWGYANQKGWVSLKYVERQKAVVGRVTASALNVRRLAKDTTSEIITVLNRGDNVTIQYMTNDGTWGYDLRHDGWVSMKYIQL